MFAAVVVLPVDPVVAAVAAQLAGPLVVVLVMAVALGSGLSALSAEKVMRPL